MILLSWAKPIHVWKRASFKIVLHAGEKPFPSKSLPNPLPEEREKVRREGGGWGLLVSSSCLDLPRSMAPFGKKGEEGRNCARRWKKETLHRLQKIGNLYRWFSSECRMAAWCPTLEFSPSSRILDTPIHSSIHPFIHVSSTDWRSHPRSPSPPFYLPLSVSLLHLTMFSLFFLG